ncbi:DUF427 domain-containing protein [Actinocatenispora sera]|uniref:DUF427 domain-containing protein n=1 Tax=Actinocatenispora sera TaxID=390989 RepID=A0A810L9C1_9ACTN|nr:DUF427 domain-containing protein [Actinocatenispora sera]BCJ32154.1 hypothetical protein Asera_62620 [Actinocatenispora sera]
MTRERKIPGPDHPITVAPSTARVVVRLGDTVLADTTSSVELREAGYPPVHYLPPDALDPAVLRPTDTTTYCPYKGEASYYTLAVDGGEAIDAVWTYRTPYPAVEQIAGHLAFYPNKVDITVEP